MGHSRRRECGSTTSPTQRSFIDKQHSTKHRKPLYEKQWYAGNRILSAAAASWRLLSMFCTVDKTRLDNMLSYDIHTTLYKILLVAVKMVIENVIFEGGGVHGLGYVGGYRCLARLDQLATIRRTGGASIGCLVALAAGLRLTPEQMMADLRSFTKTTATGDAGMCRRAYNMYTRKGWYDLAKNGRPWLNEWLKRRTGRADPTFAEIRIMYGVEVFMVVFNRSRERLEILAPDTSPDVYVVDAVLAAMSYPGMFTHQKLRGRGDDLYVDGGLINNFPLYLFDSPTYGGTGSYNDNTLGFRSVSDTSAYFQDSNGHAAAITAAPTSLVDYFTGLVAIVVESGQQRYERERDARRTVFIVFPHRIGSLDFDLDDEAKDALVDIGDAAVSKYFE